MAEEFVELGFEALDRLTDKKGDQVYDRIQPHNPLSSQYKKKVVKGQSNQQQQQPQSDIDNRQDDSRSSAGPHPKERRATLEPDYDYYYDDAADRDFERQSETSERVLRSYRNERDDPRRKPDPRLTKMSYGYDDRRPSSQGRRYDDDDGSDYDEHSGHRRRRSSGRGYDSGRRDDNYDTEIIETERYRGPPRDWGNARSPSSPGGRENGEYAVAPYRGSSDRLAPYEDKRRSRSHHGGDRDDYDRGSERSRSRGGQIKEKLEETFDGSPRGIGAGLVGAVVGGIAGKQFGNKKTSTRDMVIGAVVGGLAVNAAEQKYRDWKEEKDERERYDDRDGRSRSAYR